MTIRDEAARLLDALRRSGCDCFIDAEDGNFYCSPPAHGRRIEWPDDPEEALDAWYEDLKALLLAERLTVH
jgi:hypothetical protein